MSGFREPDAPARFGKVFEVYLLVTMTLLVGLSLFGHEVLLVLTTPQFAAGFVVVPLLVLGAVMGSIANFFAYGIQIAEKNHYRMLLNLGALAVSVSLNLAAHSPLRRTRRGARQRRVLRRARGGFPGREPAPLPRAVRLARDHACARGGDTRIAFGDLLERAGFGGGHPRQGRTGRGGSRAHGRPAAGAAAATGVAQDGRAVKEATQKVFLLQEIVPSYRVPVFRRLAATPGIDLTVFYSRPTRAMAEENLKNAMDLSGFRAVQLRLFEIGSHAWQPGILGQLICVAAPMS